MGDDHRNALWRAPEDDRTNEAGVVRTICIARVSSSSVPDGDTFCIRGLEHLVNPSALLLSNNVLLPRRQR